MDQGCQGREHQAGVNTAFHHAVVTAIAAGFRCRQLPRQALMHPVCSRQKPVIIAIGAYQLQPYRHAGVSAEKWQVYTRQTQERPGTAKQRITGKVQPDRSLSHRAGREYHVMGLKKQFNLLPCLGSCSQVFRMGLAADGQSASDPLLQLLTDLSMVPKPFMTQ